MREEEYLQCIHFGLLIKEKNHNQTIPIVLAISNEQKSLVENIPNGNCGDHDHIIRGVTLKYQDKIIAILDNYEIFPHRKEERAASIYKTTNCGHPSIKLIMESGDWLIGGDLKVFERITWNDELDCYRLTPLEIRSKLKEMNVSCLHFQFKSSQLTFLFFSG